MKLFFVLKKHFDNCIKNRQERKDKKKGARTMWWATLITIIASFGIAIIIILNSIVIVPTFRIGLVRSLKKITERRLEPGLHFIIPFIQDVLYETAGGEATTTELKKLPLKITVVSKDNQKISIEGMLFLQMDPKLTSTFVNLGKDVLSGVINAIESEIGVIAGTQIGDAFIEEKQAIQDLINSVLRLQKPPHQQAKEFWVSEEDVKPANRLKFYHEHFVEIKKLLKEEGQNTEDRSTVEKRFGIDIKTFELRLVDFSEEITKAREQKRKAQLEMEAAEERKREKIKIFKELMGIKGMSVQQALNLAETTAGTAERKVISVEGSDNPLTTAAAILAAGGGAK